MDLKIFMLLQCLSLPYIRFKWPFLCIAVKGAVKLFLEASFQRRSCKNIRSSICCWVCPETVGEFYVDYKLIFLPTEKRKTGLGGVSLFSFSLS